MYQDKAQSTLEDVKNKFKSDLHTHSIVSGHAYTTFMENVEFCKKNGMKILGTSEHGPTMAGSPHEWYFNNMRVVPRIIKGVTILRGCELNILNEAGDVDKGFDYYQKSLDYAIASFHEPIFMPKTEKEHTEAIRNVLQRHDKVIILGHLGNPNFPIDKEAVVKMAKEKDIMIEINNSSLGNGSRKGSKPNCSEIAKLCMKHETKIILTSDAHINLSIGDFERAINMLDDIEFPEHLIMNEPSKLISYLQSKNIAMDVDLSEI